MVFAKFVLIAIILTVIVVYFFLGESLMKMGNSPEALPYFERLVTEFEQSEYLQEARARIEQLKTNAAAANIAKPSR